MPKNQQKKNDKPIAVAEMDGSMEDYTSAEIEQAESAGRRANNRRQAIKEEEEEETPEEQSTTALCLRSLPILCSMIAFVFGMIGVLDCHLTSLHYKNEQGEFEFVYWMGYYSYSLEEDASESTCQFGWPEDTIKIPGAWILMAMVVVWLALGTHGIIWLLHIFRKPCKRECNIGCSLNYYIGVGMMYVILLVVGVTGRFSSSANADDERDYDNYETEFGPAAALLIVAAALCLFTSVLEHCLRTNSSIKVYEDEETKDVSEEPLNYSMVDVKDSKAKLSMDVSGSEHAPEHNA